MKMLLQLLAFTVLLSSRYVNGNNAFDGLLESQNITLNSNGTFDCIATESRHVVFKFKGHIVAQLSVNEQREFGVYPKPLLAVCDCCTGNRIVVVATPQNNGSEIVCLVIDDTAVHPVICNATVYLYVTETELQHTNHPEPTLISPTVTSSSPYITPTPGITTTEEPTDESKNEKLYRVLIPVLVAVLLSIAGAIGVCCWKYKKPECLYSKKENTDTTKPI